MENTTANKLYNLLVTRDFEPEILASSGKPITNPAEAELFSFDWKTNGVNYGTVVILLGSDSELAVYYGDNLGRAMASDHKQAWYDFLVQLKNFASRNLLTFELNNINQLKYTMQGMAAIKEGLFEGYYGRKNISYSDQPKQTRLMIRHNRDLGEGEARYRAIESLFVETANGERFRVPSRSLMHGRMLARHVAEGGTPYDRFGQYITEIVSEMATLQRFVRATRSRSNTAEAEAMIESAVRHYQDLKAKAKRMISQRGYFEARDNFDPAAFTDSEVTVEAIRDMFLETNLDPRIEEALPMLARLDRSHHEETAMKEITEFANWAHRLTEGTWAVPDTSEAKRRLQELMAQELPVGPDATNATEQIYDLIGDDKLFNELSALAAEDPDADARPLIQARLEEMGYDIGQPADDNANQELDEELKKLPFGTVNVVTPAEQRAKYKKFVQDLVADGVEEKTAYEVLDFVRNEVMRGVSWDDAVEVALRQYGIDDPYRLEREKEREQAYTADQARVRQQTIKTLQNFYKQARQRQGQERAQAIALLRRHWSQATPEQKAELERQFSADPRWQEIMRKVEQQPRRSQVDNLREQNTASGRRTPRVGDTIEWQTMRDRSPQNGRVLDIKGLTATVLPTGEQDPSRAIPLPLGNKSISYKVIQTPPPAKPATAPQWSDEFKDIRNAEGESRKEFGDKILAAGGQLKFISRGPFGPDAYELNGKEVRWQGVKKPAGHFQYVPPSAQTSAPAAGMGEDLDVDGVMMTRPSNMSSESVDHDLRRLRNLALGQ